ncbi:hypothetical protein [Kitasatospora sp. NPDC056531]|uniref:hypothetical protein n=1 Tax=Kitasatospora sp. NPDC056531 TaxID=3345856 RepID=UPI0036A3FF19
MSTGTVSPAELAKIMRAVGHDAPALTIRRVPGGHRSKVAATWYTDLAHSTLIGPTVAATFPNHDYALVRYDRPHGPPVWSSRPRTRADADCHRLPRTGDEGA